MAYKHIPAQKYFFYPSNWTAEMDNILLSSIIQHKNVHQWKSPDIPTDTLHIAAGEINQSFGVTMTWDDVYERKELLETRYSTFKQILDVPATYWDIQQHCIIADDKIWKNIFKKNIFAQAYYHNDEPEFQKLAVLFGHDDIKVESQNTVILIDSSTQTNQQNDNMTIFVSDDEEVNSPNENQFGKLRRRLFHEVSHDKDVESTNNRGPQYILTGPTGSTTFPLENDFPPPYRNNDSKPEKVDGSSSCASSSPSKWWKNPFR